MIFTVFLQSQVEEIVIGSRKEKSCQTFEIGEH